MTEHGAEQPDASRPQLLPGNRRALLASMPKAELHLHLDGSLLVSTALDLARTRGVEAPRDEAAMRAALVAPPIGASQVEFLRAFELPIAYSGPFGTIKAEVAWSE